MTVLYDISVGAKRLRSVAQHRTEASLKSCLDELGQEFCLQIKFVCREMWQPDLNVIGERLGQAIHVLGRLHIMKQFGKCSTKSGPRRPSVWSETAMSRS